MECFCKGKNVTVKINGVIVNQGIYVRPEAGKILFQSEGHEVYFRNIEIKALPKGDVLKNDTKLEPNSTGKDK